MMDWSAFGLSIQLALGTLAVLLPVGLLVGRWLARTPFKGRTWLEAAILLPLVLPPTVMGYYLLVALGGASPVGQWLQNSFGISLTFNFTGLLLASVVFNIPFMIQPIQRAFESIPMNLNEAAQVSGLSTWAISSSSQGGWCSRTTSAPSWLSATTRGSTGRPLTNIAPIRIRIRTMSGARVTCSRMRPVSRSPH